MANVNKSGKPSLSTRTPSAEHSIVGLSAGEDIAAGDACYIHSNGTVMRSTGAAANAAAKVRGFAGIDAQAGDAITLFHGVNFAYGSGLTPGADLFLSGTTPGGLVDAASTGGSAPIGFVIDTQRVHLFQSRY